MFLWNWTAAGPGGTEASVNKTGPVIWGWVFRIWSRPVASTLQAVTFLYQHQTQMTQSLWEFGHSDLSFSKSLDDSGVFTSKSEFLYRINESGWRRKQRIVLMSTGHKLKMRLISSLMWLSLAMIVIVGVWVGHLGWWTWPGHFQSENNEARLSGIYIQDVTGWTI